MRLHLDGRMQKRLFLAIITSAAVAGAVTEGLVFWYAHPPDATAAMLGGLWLAMPYLVAALLAFNFRRHKATLIVLVSLLALASFIGISFTYSAVSQQRVADQQVKDAVQPGEDPDLGPAAMRKSGAEMGAAISFGFMIVLAVVIPPIQTVVIAMPTIILGLLIRAGQAHLRQAG
jgi:glucose dehydrogenase